MKRGRKRKPSVATGSPTRLGRKLGVTRQRAHQMMNREKHRAAYETAPAASKPELEPCPLCGNAPQMNKPFKSLGRSFHWVVCDCGAQGPQHQYKHTAIEKWNTRAPQPAVERLLHAANAVYREANNDSLGAIRTETLDALGQAIEEVEEQ